jgi:hypothetical protein
MVEIRYVGPGMAVVAGKALWSGETRTVSRKIAEKLKEDRPDDIEISEVGQGETVSVETPVPPLNPVDEMAAKTVDEIRKLAADAPEPDVVGHWIQLEQAGKARKTALEALEARLAELEQRSEDEAPPEEATPEKEEPAE